MSSTEGARRRRSIGANRVVDRETGSAGFRRRGRGKPGCREPRRAQPRRGATWCRPARGARPSAPPELGGVRQRRIAAGPCTRSARARCETPRPISGRARDQVGLGPRARAAATIEARRRRWWCRGPSSRVGRSKRGPRRRASRSPDQRTRRDQDHVGIWRRDSSRQARLAEKRSAAAWGAIWTWLIPPIWYPPDPRRPPT